MNPLRKTRIHGELLEFRDDSKVPRPSSEGTSGQILRTNGDGTTRWDNAATQEEIGSAVENWLGNNVTSGETLIIDSSLTMSGAAADAKAIGDNIRGINSRIKKWNVLTNGKIVFLGNSYGKNRDENNNPITTLWPYIVASLLGLGAEGGNWWNVCEPGHSLASQDLDYKIINDFEAWVTGHSSELNNIGAVICVAGLNDSTSYAVPYILPSMQALINSINTSCPNAKVYFGYTGFLNESINLWNHPGTAGGRFYALLEYQQCEHLGAIYLSGVENIIHCKEYMDADGIHPNDIGSNLLARGVVNALLQGYAPYNGRYRRDIHPITNAWTAVFFKTNEGTENEYVENGHIVQDVNDGMLVNGVRFGLQFGDDALNRPEWQVGHEYEVATVTLPYTNSQVLGDFTAECITNDNDSVLAFIRAQIIARKGYTDTLYFKIKGYSDGASIHRIKEMLPVAFNVSNHLQTADEIPVSNDTITFTAAAGKLNKPTTSPNGTSGQVLQTNGDGTTTWVSLSQASVENGSITYAKLDSSLQSDHDRLETLLADYYYIPLTINAFTLSPSQAEIGSTVSSVACTFAISKVPDALYLDNIAQTAANSGTIDLTGQSITQNKTFTLKATDERNENGVTKTATLSFLNRICYGAATIPETINSAFLLGLANTPLSGTKGRSFSNANATSGKYIWYAVPARLGTCLFRVGGFIGGFEAPSTVSVTNASGHTEDYYVYRSTNAGLGSPEIIVT